MFKIKLGGRGCESIIDKPQKPKVLAAFSNTLETISTLLHGVVSNIPVCVSMKDTAAKKALDQILPTIDLQASSIEDIYQLIHAKLGAHVTDDIKPYVMVRTHVETRQRIFEEGQPSVGARTTHRVSCERLVAMSPIPAVSQHPR